jgi:hypothetical protein
MGIPSSWPLAYKRVVLLAAFVIVLVSYFVMCLALARLSVLFIH